MSLSDVLLAPTRDGDPARPLITFYDDETGERIELSGLTFTNWVAKTANLLRDECDVEPGVGVAVLLPPHWQTAVALLACWACGGVAVEDPADADVALCAADTLAAGSEADLTVGFSLDAFGRGLDDPPADVVDYATEVRVHGDHFSADPLPIDTPVLTDVSGTELLVAARARAAELELTPTDRVLSTATWPLAPAGGLVDGLLAVFAVGASLVHVRRPDPTALDRRAEIERVTRRVS